MPWMVEAHSDLALLRRLAVGLPKFGINDTCLHTGTVEQQFFFSNGRLPPSFMCNDYNGLSAIHIFEMLSSHGGCWPAIMQEYLIFVMLGHPVPCRCSAHHNSLYLCLWLFKKKQDEKTVCSTYHQSPILLNRTACVFKQLLSPGIPSWEGDKSSECTFCTSGNSTEFGFLKNESFSSIQHSYQRGQ